MEIQEYPHSLGTQKLMDMIQSWNITDPDKVWDTTIINAATILRNNIDKYSTNRSAVEGFNKDIGALVFAIYEHQLKSLSIDNPYFIIYVPNYSKIPKILLRELPTNEQKIDNALNLLSTQIKNKKDGDLDVINNLPIYSILAGGKFSYPYMDVYRKINQANMVLKDLRKISTRRYMFISHIAFDFYLFKHLKDVRLLESFTGNIKREKDLSKKLFDDEGIPFNKYTHVLFGDKTRIRPIVKNSKKKEYIELAHRTRWDLKTEEQIKGSILSHDPMLGVILNRLDF